MAEEIGLGVDVDGFNKAKKEAKEESKTARKNVGPMFLHLFTLF